jgi:hypothetical protein
MNLTQKSNELIALFSKNNQCLKKTIKKDTKLDDIFLQIYDDIHTAYYHTYIGCIDNKREARKSHDPKITLTDINTIQDVPYPTKFPLSSFPDEIRNHINVTSKYRLDYNIKTTTYHGNAYRDVTFHFVVEDTDAFEPNKYISYAQDMLAWLHIVDGYAQRDCAKNLDIFLYFTSLGKQMPQSNLHVLGENHANTAFTTTCPSVSEIVIFRAEEWFKVFIHETFHNFALDFSDMSNDDCHKKIKQMFNVKSDINLFEAYTETWAEIMNICFCSYHSLGHNLHDPVIYVPGTPKYAKKQKEFVTTCKQYLNIEQGYSAFQMVKTIGFMGLTYDNLISNAPRDEILRNTLYKEQTNILAYYVIKCILMTNYKDFLFWCDRNNTSLIQFKKTRRNQASMCTFVKERYNSKSFLREISCYEEYTSQMIQKKNTTKKKKTKISYLLSNLRMTLFELG